MAKIECEREPEVLRLVREGRWPAGADDELCAHAATCVACGDASIVASALSADFAASVPRVAIPSSGVMWWRLQRRAREDAAAAARKAVTVVQGASIAAGVLIATAVVPSIWKSTDWSAWTASGGEMLRDVIAVSGSSLLLGLALGACVAAAPVALLFAFRE